MSTDIYETKFQCYGCDDGYHPCVILMADKHNDSEKSLSYDKCILEYCGNRANWKVVHRDKKIER